jgi:hypothetical protein
MKVDECFHCAETIWFMEEKMLWVHMESGHATCKPTTLATPKIVWLG